MGSARRDGRACVSTCVVEPNTKSKHSGPQREKQCPDKVTALWGVLRFVVVLLCFLSVCGAGDSTWGFTVLQQLSTHVSRPQQVFLLVKVKVKVNNLFGKLKYVEIKQYVLQQLVDQRDQRKTKHFWEKGRWKNNTPRLIGLCEIPNPKNTDWSQREEISQKFEKNQQNWQTLSQASGKDSNV